MLKNNCQCELCRSVWEGAGYMKNTELCADDEERDKLTRIEAAIRASFQVPPLSLLHSTKDIAEAPHENN